MRNETTHSPIFCADCGDETNPGWTNDIGSNPDLFCGPCAIPYLEADAIEGNWSAEQVLLIIAREAAA